MAIGLIVGGYAFVSSDFSSQVINNPVSNEMDDVNDNVSLPDEEKMSGDISLSNEELVKSIASSSVLQQLSNVVLDMSPDSTTDLDNSTKISSYVGYTAGVADVSIGGQPSGGKDPYFYPLQQGTLPFDNINKSDYILSPNYKDHIFIKKGQDFTDKYGWCVEDGFIPLGNITIPLETDFICHLNCGIGDSYFDLSSPYIYDAWDAKYYLKNGEFPDEVQKERFEYETNQLNMNYRQLPGHDEIFLNVHDDFTDKYLLCMDCGRYVVLGNVTVPLDDVMICDYPLHFGVKNYFDINNPAIISREEALDSWNNDHYLQELYSNPDYHPIHSNEEIRDLELSNEPSQQHVEDTHSELHITIDYPELTVYSGNVGINSTI
ncbi:MAG: hypothetical protein IJQ68_08075 [Methanobrevibacter sp.]|uniref:hypothetical protein n=1 Tax=Methanobrevibacter sp. TaxID=66852 RepID=UPI0025E17DBF|nr:hypothetical protein [Methanobrevibacter sp.]MBR0271926.1 hypothetical protein [Methanobrevibacter sp.]